MTAVPQGLAGLMSLADFEAAACRQFEHRIFEFVASGAADDITLDWNCTAYSRIALVPRAIEDQVNVDTSITLFDASCAHPIMLAPISRQSFIHPDGECASVRGADAAQATFVISGFTSKSIEAIRQAAPRARLWFQLYAQRDMHIMESAVRSAEAAACQALCVTLDAPIPGLRPRLDRVGFRLEVNGLPHGGQDRPTTWRDVTWLRAASKLPLVVKGVLHPDDARRALDAGADAIGVSNHGGRCLDTSLATVDALPAVVAAVSGRVPVLVDGGIRRGTDILKALALGARAVLVGRPYAYGLGLAGAPGVSRVIEILWRELAMAMVLTGQLNAHSVDPGTVHRSRHA